LGTVSLLNDIASEMIFPLLPQFLIAAIGGNKFYLGVIEGVADTVASLLKVWSGAWSDRMKRRRGFVIWGYGLSIAARAAIAAVINPWQLLMARTGDRIGKGVRTAPRDALIAESTAPGARGRAFGFHRSMDHLGAAIGPLVAAAFLFFYPGELRTLFLLTIVPGLVILGMLWAGLREADVVAPPRHATPSKSRTPLRGKFRLYLIALAIFTLGNSSDAFLLVRAAELGVPTALLPVLWCAFNVTKSLTTYAAGGLVDRVGSRLPMIGGWIIYAGVYIAFALATEAWQVCVLFLVYALFDALTEPAEKTLVAELVPGDQKGQAYGWYSFTIGVTALPASLMFGALYEAYGPMASFGTGAALAMVAVVPLLFCTKAR
jgi:sugar phosphate permease